MAMTIEHYNVRPIDKIDNSVENLIEYKVYTQDYTLPKKTDYKNKKLTALLLSAPIINDDELELYRNVREWMNQRSIGQKSE